MTPPLPRHPRCLPTGAALLEIMIGLAIGLLICATALNALHISRALSEITGDAIAMQQDVTTALRIIGLQIRQAGSAALDLQPALSAGDATQQGAVVFEPAPEARPDANGTPTMEPSVAAPVVAKSTGATLQLRHASPTEDLFKSRNSTIRGSQQHDCLGQNTSNRLLASIITSTFFVRDGQLMCTGVAGSPQPMISHVKGFAVRMLVQSFEQNQEGEYSLFYVDASDLDSAMVARGRAVVRAVEVCLEIESPRAAPPDTHLPYRRCNGEQPVRSHRLVHVTRHLFAIRPQGW